MNSSGVLSKSHATNAPSQFNSQPPASHTNIPSRSKLWRRFFACTFGFFHSTGHFSRATSYAVTRPPRKTTHCNNAPDRGRLNWCWALIVLTNWTVGQSLVFTPVRQVPGPPIRFFRSGSWPSSGVRSVFRTSSTF